VSKPTDLVQGTLDLLILKTLSLGPAHGWAVGQRIEQISNDVLQVQQGPCIPPCTAWNSRAGFAANGANPRTTAARDSTL
jgi:PadR family transcriptional regulator, regulatory protein PadR